MKKRNYFLQLKIYFKNGTCKELFFDSYLGLLCCVFKYLKNKHVEFLKVVK